MKSILSRGGRCVKWTSQPAATVKRIADARITTVRRFGAELEKIARDEIDFTKRLFEELFEDASGVSTTGPPETDDGAEVEPAVSVSSQESPIA